MYTHSHTCTRIHSPRRANLTTTILKTKSMKTKRSTKTKTRRMKKKKRKKKRKIWVMSIQKENQHLSFPEQAQGGRLLYQEEVATGALQKSMTRLNEISLSAWLSPVPEISSPLQMIY
ncbi:hypothetical protein AX15_004737 [Amanita polypyramis BW_CC]|nr:hypothetical protein AX15_004737 [Amanita polypyramis BW_CC]